MFLKEEIFNFVQKHKDDDIHKLLLSKQELSGEELKFAVQQIEGRQRVKNKLPEWYNTPRILYPVHLSLEQCSSAETAKYKASLVQGDSLIDLTGGFGVDTSYLAQKFDSVVYVERNPDLYLIVSHNFKQMGLNHIQTINSEAESVLKDLELVDTVFIDPARRDNTGGKLVSIGDCVPNVIELQSIFQAKAKQVLIKLSPMLDLTQALRELDYVSHVYIVALSNECKELLVLVDYTKEETKNPQICCVNLGKNDQLEEFSFSLNDEERIDVGYATEVKKYLFEPNVAVLKGGAYKSIAKRFNVDKLHPNSHLYTSDRYSSDFPGRKFEINEVLNFNKTSLKKLKAITKKANLTIRNFPSSVDSLRKKLKIAEGGEKYIFATTLMNEERVLLVCSKLTN